MRYKLIDKITSTIRVKHEDIGRYLIRFMYVICVPFSHIKNEQNRFLLRIFHHISKRVDSMGFSILFFFFFGHENTRKIDI